EAYFELFPVQMLAKATLLFQKPAVPEGYFNSLPSVMLAKVKSMEQGDELKVIAPVLENISRQMPYSIPAGYFENLVVDYHNTAPVLAIDRGRRSDLRERRPRSCRRSEAHRVQLRRAPAARALQADR
ncbi:MAG: hypothetical protein ABIS45_14095, partial [Burkholderiales bacterium]